MNTVTPQNRAEIARRADTGVAIVDTKFVDENGKTVEFDGIADMVKTDRVTGEVTVHRGLGDGRFAKEGTFIKDIYNSISKNGNPENDIAMTFLADTNTNSAGFDGDLDMIEYDNVAATVKVYKGDGNGNFATVGQDITSQTYWDFTQDVIFFQNPALNVLDDDTNAGLIDVDGDKMDDYVGMREWWTPNFSSMHVFAEAQMSGDKSHLGDGKKYDVNRDGEVEQMNIWENGQNPVHETYSTTFSHYIDGTKQVQPGPEFGTTPIGDDKFYGYFIDDNGVNDGNIDEFFILHNPYVTPNNQMVPFNIFVRQGDGEGNFDTSGSTGNNGIMINDRFDFTTTDISQTQTEKRFDSHQVFDENGDGVADQLDIKWNDVTIPSPFGGILFNIRASSTDFVPGFDINHTGMQMDHDGDEIPDNVSGGRISINSRLL